MTGTEYQKIPGPFKRDPKTNQLTKQWTSPELEALANSNIWYFTEKIDGTNVRVFWDGYKVSWLGRTDSATFSDPMLDALNSLFGGPDNETLFEQQFGVEPAILYGELYGPKIQSGGIYRDDITFALFDVRIGSFWLIRDAVENIAEGLGLDLVPLMLWGVSLEMAIQHVEVGLYSEVSLESKSAPFAEGLVGFTHLGLLNRRGERIAVKVKHRDLYTGS